MANIATVVDRLAAGGMQHLLALNVPDLSKTPNALAAANQSANSAVVLANIQALASGFNAALSQELVSLAQADDFNLSLVDTYSAVQQIVAHPGAYGLADVTDACWTGNFTDAGSGHVCAKPSDYLFWDGLHPTAAGHQLVANAALAALPAAVPEPENSGLFLLSLAAIALLLERRRHRSNKPRRAKPIGH